MEETTQKETQPQNPSHKEKNTGMAIVAYIIFFVPLLTEAKNDPFVKYHVKQGLVIFIGWIAVGIIGYILGYAFYIGWMLARLLNLFLFILMIIGIKNASQGEKKPLPIIGKFGEKFKF
jgi:uncharacterized membrane protein